jgi:hypothetical protein
MLLQALNINERKPSRLVFSQNNNRIRVFVIPKHQDGETISKLAQCLPLASFLPN